MTGLAVRRVHNPSTPLRQRRAGPDWIAFTGAEDTVIVHARVFGALRAWAARADPVECLGLLAGRVFEDASGRYSLLMGAVVVEDAVGSRAHVLADGLAMRRTRELIHDRFPASDAMGWWHAHPGFGTAFSNVDRETQATFDAPHLVGVVIDPRVAGIEAFSVYLGPGSHWLSPAPGTALAGYAGRGFTAGSRGAT